MAYVTKSNRNRRERRKAQGLCVGCGETPVKPGDSITCDDCYARTRELRFQARIEVINHYGGKCACCGNEQPRFLQLDHIDGGGTKHHNSLTTSMLGYLKKNNFPPGFRVLCANCNMAIGFYGFCPHHPEVVRSTRRGPSGN